MGQSIPTQHPAVVLRSHYNHLRALLVIAAIAVVGLTTAVVILANDEEPATSVSTATPAVAPTTGERYDGGPEEGTAEVSTSRAPVSRYDGGPEEGTAEVSTSRAPVSRYDGGPEEGTAARAQSPAPTQFGSSTQSVTPPPSSIAAGEGSAYGQLRQDAPPQRYDGGPEEGTTGPGH